MKFLWGAIDIGWLSANDGEYLRKLMEGCEPHLMPGGVHLKSRSKSSEPCRHPPCGALKECTRVQCPKYHSWRKFVTQA